MKFFYALLFLVSTPLMSGPIRTDYAIFLFDHGDKNMVASMLKYAEQEAPAQLAALDFKIVFMGASVEAMQKAPFSRYPDQLVHYTHLGIKETIDHTWKRDRKIEPESLKALLNNLHVRKKVWVGVSCSIFEQIARAYQEIPHLEVVAVRDNPSPVGDTDYFTVAKQVEKAAHSLAVPSAACAREWEASGKRIAITGHGPIEEWQKEASRVDKEALLKQLHLDPQVPILVYAGVYGDRYEKAFRQFLNLLPQKGVQVLIAPHPRYQGVVETRICEQLGSQVAIVGEFVKDPFKKIKTVEAIAIADFVVTADATSTVVFQAGTLGKKVLYVNPELSQVSIALCKQGIIERVSSADELSSILNTVHRFSQENPNLKAFGIPPQGAKLLWENLSLESIQKVRGPSLIKRTCM